MKDSQISLATLTSPTHPWALQSGMRFAVNLFTSVLHDPFASKYLAYLLMVQQWLSVGAVRIATARIVVAQESRWCCGLQEGGMRS